VDEEETRYQTLLVLFRCFHRWGVELPEVDAIKDKDAGFPLSAIVHVIASRRRSQILMGFVHHNLCSCLTTEDGIAFEKV
jgi:predicted MarR family transcription regulator